MVPTFSRESRFNTRVAVTFTVMFLLCACSGAQDVLPEEESSSNSTGHEAPPVTLAAADLEARSAILRERDSAQKLDRLNDRVKEAMAGYLKDPASAQLRSIRSGRNDGVCGEVNGKNSYGAYVGFKPFVITKSNSVITSNETGYDYFYLEHCASEGERQSRVIEDETKSETTTETTELDYGEAAGEIENATMVPDDPFAD